MTRITLDRATLALLHYLIEPLELCDESGRILGTFTPAVDGSPNENVEGDDLRRREEEARLGTPLGPLAYTKDLE
jgi:hypothetical protein